MDNWNKEILRLAIPSIISNVTVPLLGLVDLAVVGHIGNETYISAIAVGSMIFNVIYWLLGFLRMGTSGMTSQAYGRQDAQECLNILIRTLMIGVGMGIVFVIAQRGIEWGMLRLMNTPKVSWHYVAIYFRIVIWGAPAMLGLYGLTGWFIGMQDTRTPMMVAVLQNLVNIVASLFFVFVLGWQISGVAAGTVIAQWAGFVVSLYAANKRIKSGKEEGLNSDISNSEFLRSTFRRVLAMQGEWSEFFRVNKDIFLRTLCLVAVNFFFTSAGGKQGAMMLAVNTLLMTLFTLFSYMMDGFAYAGEALSGKYYGAGDKIGLHITVHRLFGFGFVMVLMFTTVYVFGGVDFLRLLTSDTAVVAAAQPYLLWAYLIPLAGMAAFVLDGVFIGLTETKGMLFSTAMAMVTFFAVYSLFCGDYGNNALWIAFLSFLGMRGIASILWARRYLVIF
ncbi:MATE family efflux transporter [Prevotella melaninogenica]|uniref:MATE family efflux transporter n=1 Tax=Prevotella melaninogenica TaxID=28132 RepID=A0ABX7XNA0_9BACT|nr:MATE family efflux transporter [Prevotella melaninogenica]QUB74986.1 MATE family efflux transporter [Prevotella melaninogenica]